LKVKKFMKAQIPILNFTNTEKSQNQLACWLITKFSACPVLNLLDNSSKNEYSENCPLTTASCFSSSPLPTSSQYQKKLKQADIRIFLFLFLALLLWFNPAFAQNKVYINHTEFGPMIGRVKVWDNNFDPRVNFSIQSFNGVRIDKNHALGFLLGLDTYPNFNLVPMAIGWRGFLEKGKRTTPFAGFDIGKGSAILEKREVNEWGETWYEGGFLASPQIGLRRNSKKGTHAFTWSLGFKRQHAFFYEGVRDFFGTGTTQANNLPPGFSSVREEAYVFNSLLLKWGLMF